MGYSALSGDSDLIRAEMTAAQIPVLKVFSAFNTFNNNNKSVLVSRLTLRAHELFEACPKLRVAGNQQQHTRDTQYVKGEASEV